MKPYQLEKKKRRIQKKLFLGEFAVLGFEIRCETNIQDFDRYDQFVDDFIDYIESLDLCFGGGGFETFDGFLCSVARYGSATSEQQALVGAWLEKREEVTKVEIGELVDANYF